MDRGTVTGDIILRRNQLGKTGARAQTMAALFKSIMRLVSVESPLQRQFTATRLGPRQLF